MMQFGYLCGHFLGSKCTSRPSIQNSTWILMRKF